MTFSEFIATKPDGIRLGQWFVICYWKGSDEISQKLFQLDGRKAVEMIDLIMELYQWDTLPNIKGETK